MCPERAGGRHLSEKLQVLGRVQGPALSRQAGHRTSDVENAEPVAAVLDERRHVLALHRAFSLGGGGIQDGGGEHLAIQAVGPGPGIDIARIVGALALEKHQDCAAHHRVQQGTVGGEAHDGLRACGPGGHVIAGEYVVLRSPLAGDAFALAPFRYGVVCSGS